MSQQPKETRRLTLPVECGIDQEIKELLERLGADAVRNSDGTELPEMVKQLAVKVYANYYPARGDQSWADAHPDQRIHSFLMSKPKTAFATDPLVIKVLDGYFDQQLAVELDCDLDRYWQVIDRTTGEVLNTDEYRIDPAPVSQAAVAHAGKEAQGAVVTITRPRAYHRYTVNFLARQIWDSTQMYNYLTNGWENDPTRVKEKPYDVAYLQTWKHLRAGLADWLAEHREVDVVRFTTFFYHFTLFFNQQGKEKYVDWFGYSASVSIPALQQFAQQYGYELTPEDFVDQGYYNSPFRLPSKPFRDWVEFQSANVADKARQLVEQVHTQGKEAIMFLGDNWIGTEPYGKFFPQIGLDAVVGSVGSAATCRMIADIPGVKYSEGRFLPYFFPDVFREGGDPTREANECWRSARRAIVRNPLDRIGYGGYLSLALKFDDFMERIEQIIGEFRQIHTESAGERPAVHPGKIAIVNAWGSLRTWQTHMVAHALWYRRIYSYLGVIEALAGLPFEVEFLSFQQIKSGIDPDVKVLINAGSAGTSFSGGEVWKDAQLQAEIRKFVARGGGLIGIGDPSFCPQNGQSFALADVFGVDRELDFSLSYDRYPQVVPHFITAEAKKTVLSEESSAENGLSTPASVGPDAAHDLVSQPQLNVVLDLGEDPGFNFALDDDTQILALDNESVQAAAHQYGKGRAVYLSGCQYSPKNTRLLYRALLWAAGLEDRYWHLGWSNSPQVEVAYYPGQQKYLIYSQADTPLDAVITLANGKSIEVNLPELGSQWIKE